MDTPGERPAAAELLAATRDLVAVNREIAGTLARLEQLYAREVERNADMRARTNAMMSRVGGPAGAWGWLVTMLIPLAVVLIVLLK
jgi:hypothetical protein